MKKSYSKWSKKESISQQAQLELVSVKHFVQRELREFVVSAGMTALSAMLEDERTAICGPRYAHATKREAYRGGHTRGELVLGGRRVSVLRPRARGLDGHEHELPSWKQFSGADPLHARALEQMLVGVSTRKYARSLEDVPTATRGTSKSPVSRRFVEITKEKMAELFGRDLSGIDLAVVMLDGVHISDHVILVALGIDTAGEKHVLGIREGATENATACTELLTQLRERGMSTEKTTLFVLDGGKALKKSVVDVFGKRAKIQRCQVHKLRNVLDQLPEYMRPSVKSVLQQAYACGNVVHARKLLTNLMRTLKTDHPSAAASVEEGLEETLTVMAMKLPRTLERIFSTTNAVENLMGSVRDLSRRVKHWKNGEMVVRWTTTAVLEAGKRFRRIRGHKAMPQLVRALRALEAVEMKENTA